MHHWKIWGCTELRTHRSLAAVVSFIVVLMSSASPIFAADAGGAEVASGSARGLATLDWIVIGAYGAGMLLLGVFFARRQKTTAEFFTGAGKMGSVAVGLSIHATLLSTISYLGVPGEMIGRGPVILCAMVGIPITFIVVGYFVVPALMKRRVTSAYEMLEQRLGLGPRLMAAALFLMLRFIWMGLMVNAAATKAIIPILGLSGDAADKALPWIVILCSFVAIAYTALGGLRAVVITDVVQFLLLLGGAILTVAIVTAQMGVEWFPTQWADHWEQQPVFDTDPHTRVTIVGSIMAAMLWWICTACSDQTAVQRFMATGDTQGARRSFLITMAVEPVLSVMLGLVGFALLGYFTLHSNLLGADGDIVAQADKMFPIFIANVLPAGIAGLVVAAMLAALMSSLDSGINSATAVIQVDFIDRFRRRGDTAEHDIWTARGLSVAIGVVIIAMNYFVSTLKEDNIIEQTNKLVNTPVWPLFTVFFIGIFVPFGTPFGAVIGGLYALATGTLVAFWVQITDLDQAISFQWIPPMCLAAGLGPGILLSLLPTRGRPFWLLLVLGVVLMLPVIAVYAWAISLRPEFVS